MPKLKTYSLGNHGFVRTEVTEALGLPRHVRQVTVVVVEASKVAAKVLLETRGHYISLRDQEFRLASGNDVDALAEAGMFDAPAVFAWPQLGGSTYPVVRLSERGLPEPVGVFRRNGGSLVFS